MEYSSHVNGILTSQEYKDRFGDESNWPVYVELSNGKLIGCDLVISATGVVPAVDIFTKHNKVKANNFIKNSLG